MKDEVKKALDLLRDTANQLAFSSDKIVLAKYQDMVKEHSSAYETLERALTDTTLEIVKKYLTNHPNKSGNPDPVRQAIIEIIIEAESAK